MTKRALLIGSQTGGLLGTENDIEAMTNALAPRGFAIASHLDGRATRQGILEAYHKLIEQTAKEDCVLLYYSGHGARAKNPDYDANNPTQSPAYHQFIVPTDIYDSSDKDFRGITNHELSHLLTQLTAQTRNVTVVLDCCHSALMSRGPEQFMPKALPREWYVGVTSHLDGLRSQGIDVSGRPVGNPHAVGVVACGPNQSAYEYGVETGRRMGILTESLCIALDEARELEHVDWRSIGVRIRERSQAVFPAQLPVIEGPASRLVFDLQEVEHTDVLSVVKRHEHWVLEGGRIFGINVGDQYAIMPRGSAKVNQNTKIATATVTSVGGSSSGIEIEYQPGHQELSETALAFPTVRAAKRFPVKVVAEGTAGSALSKEVVRDSQLTLVEDPHESACTTARIVNGRIDLYDNTAVLLFEGKSNDNQGIEETLMNLRILGKAEFMRNLRGGEGASRLNASVNLVWGRVEGGKEHPLPLQGDVIHVGELVFIRVINRSNRHIWISLFDIGLTGKRTLINGNLAPLGVELGPNDDYTVGMNDGVLKGLTLSWPSGLPADAPRPESLVIMVMDREQDLRPLEGAGMRSGAKGGGGDSELQRLLEQVETGQTRDVGADKPPTDLKYDVHHINFFVDPFPVASRAKTEFLIDETPDRSVLAWSPKGFVGTVPQKVAVCLTDLIIHKNRAFGSATIRVDTMVISKSAPEKSPNLWQQTFRFPQIRDGDALPFGKQVIYVGAVEDFLTLGVWISRDTKASQDLAKLFEAKLNSDKFKTAATVIAGLAVAAPQAALGVVAVSAASTLLSMGSQLLNEALPKSIGLYTNSFLPSDSFGVGKHPPSGLLSAQDFSFGYIISDESEANR